MEVFIGMIIGFIICLVIGVFTGFGEDNELLNQLQKEKQQNRDLREALDNAELRATKFARKIKSVEDIIRSEDLDINKVDKIRKELFTETTQEK